MITFKEVTQIASKLSILEELKEPLLNVIEDIDTLLKKGNSWLGNIEKKTYKEMKELLDCYMTDILSRCFSIARSVQQKISEPSEGKDKVEQLLDSLPGSIASPGYANSINIGHFLSQIEELSSSFAAQGDLLKAIQQKCKDQEENLSSVLKQTNTRYEEMMKEIYAASNFMSNLSIKMNKTKEKELNQDEKIQEVSHKLETHIQQCGSNAKEGENVEALNSEIKRLTHKLEKYVHKIEAKDKDISKLKEDLAKERQNVEALENEIKSLTHKFEKYVYKIEAKDKDISKLKEDLAQANNPLKRKATATLWLINSSDFHSCLNAAAKVRGMDIKYFLKNTRDVYGDLQRLFQSPPFSKHSTTASHIEDLLIHITKLLHDLGFNAAERDVFWDEYAKY